MTIAGHRFTGLVPTFALWMNDSSISVPSNSALMPMPLGFDHSAECFPGVRHALLPPVADGSSAPCGAELFLFSYVEEAPPRIRQSRSYPRREQSFALTGVRHALLPPAADGSSAPCGAELYLFSYAEEAPPRIRQSRSDPRREQSFAQSGVRHALLPPVVDGSSVPCGAELFSSLKGKEYALHQASCQLINLDPIRSRLREPAPRGFTRNSGRPGRAGGVLSLG